MKLLAFENLPRFIKTLHPPLEEIESYARMILQHEGRPLSALPDCRREAELQLWASRCFKRQTARRRAPRAAAPKPAGPDQPEAA